MTPDAMAGGVLLIDAIGKEARIEFMTGFVQDQLIEYSKIYKPVKEQPKEKPRVSSFMAQPEEPKENKKPEFALEFVENRFVWFSRLLTDIQQKYPGVFPAYWNLEYHLAKNFLRRVSGLCVTVLDDIFRSVSHRLYSLVSRQRAISLLCLVAPRKIPMLAMQQFY
jgi:hypothetical protein